MIEYLEVGKIVNTHGLKGEVKVMPLTDNMERFEELETVIVDEKNNLVTYAIEQVKYFKETVILKLKGIENIDQAEKLKGFFLKIDRKNAVKLSKDAYFICDLIGCDVFDENNKNLGKVIDVLKTGSNDNYHVRDENKKEILIPALKSVVTEISIENKRINVVLPKGLVDDEV